MEDVVPEAESLLHPVNLSSKEEVEIHQREEEEEEEAGNKEGEEKPSGFLNHLISNLVVGEEANKERIIEENDNKRRKTEAEGKTGGLLDHIIRNFVSPLSPKAAAEVNQKKIEVSESSNGGSRKENEGSGSSEAVGINGGGLIKNVISNLCHPSDQVANNNEKIDEEKIEENEEEKTKGGGGIIDNIVSHLPASLRDDAAPTTDEAAILLHSIVHD